jgi:NADPH-dependent 2,4-dienoyl-CoA reductase/sulfur reductase-like enzyme
VNTVAVVGASLAGLSAARALREQGFTGELVVVGEESHRPYDRPPLSKDFLAGRVDVSDLALETDDEQLQARWLLGTRATALDAATRRLTLSDGSHLDADGIVIATGARARTLPGTEALAGVHTLRTVDDAVALRGELVPGRRLVVIGAGFIGAETASTAHALGLDVTVVEAMATPLSGPLGVQMGAVVCRLHTDHGVRLECGTGVHRLVGAGRVEGVELADGSVLPADLVLVGIGAIANIGWLQGSGLALGNGVLCDAGGLTSRPGIAAVGDCAAWLDESSGQHQRVEHWTGALERPRVAVAGLLSGSSATVPVSPPYFWSDQYDVRIQFAGTTRHGDVVTVQTGDPADRSFLATYHRDGELVAVLGMNQVRQFTRWRRQLVAGGLPGTPVGGTAVPATSR